MLKIYIMEKRSSKDFIMLAKDEEVESLKYGISFVYNYEYKEIMTFNKEDKAQLLTYEKLHNADIVEIADKIITDFKKSYKC